MVDIWQHISALLTKVVSAALCSNAMVLLLLLLIHCLLLLPLLVGGGGWSMYCYTVLSLQSRFLIISLRKRELVA